MDAVPFDQRSNPGKAQTQPGRLSSSGVEILFPPTQRRIRRQMCRCLRPHKHLVLRARARFADERLPGKGGKFLITALQSNAVPVCGMDAGKRPAAGQMDPCNLGIQFPNGYPFTRQNRRSACPKRPRMHTDALFPSWATPEEYPDEPGASPPSAGLESIDGGKFWLPERNQLGGFGNAGEVPAQNGLPGQFRRCDPDPPERDR